MRNPILLIVAFVAVAILVASRSDAKKSQPCVGPQCPTVDVDAPRVKVRVRMDNDCDQITETEKEIVQGVNDFRADLRRPDLKINKGLQVLRVDPILMEVAREMSQKITQRNAKRYHGQGVWNEVHASGFKGRVTDNLFFGHPQHAYSGREAVDGWENSSIGHDYQMMGYVKVDGRWKWVGWDSVGVAKSGTCTIAIFGKSNPEKSVTKNIRRQPSFRQPASCPNCRRN